MQIMFELNILDETGNFFDMVGEYNSLEDARKSRDMYQLEYPEDKYSITKVTREDIE